MTLGDVLFDSYAWADAHAAAILLGGFLWPVAGTLAARVGKGGRTDADGRFIASAVMGVSLVAVAVEVAALVLARTFAGHSFFDANVLLAVAPVVALAGSVVGIRLVFPLSELGSVRTAWDLCLFLLALVAVGFFFKKFRGWGIFFVGGFTQLLVVLAVAGFFILRLGRRALGLSKRDDARPASSATRS